MKKILLILLLLSSSYKANASINDFFGGNYDVTMFTNRVTYFANSIKSFYLDTGVLLPKISKKSNFLRVDYLYKEPKGISGWLGPYAIEPSKDSKFFNSIKKLPLTHIQPEGNQSIAFVLRDGNFNKCDQNKNCRVWGVVSNVDKKLFKATDKKNDNKNGPKKGRIRYNEKAQVLFYDIRVSYLDE